MYLFVLVIFNFRAIIPNLQSGRGQNIFGLRKRNLDPFLILIMPVLLLLQQTHSYPGLYVLYTANYFFFFPFTFQKKGNNHLREIICPVTKERESGLNEAQFIKEAGNPHCVCVFPPSTHKTYFFKTLFNIAISFSLFFMPVPSQCDTHPNKPNTVIPITHSSV